MYKMLEDGEGFPRVHFLGKEGNYNVMVIDLMGPSLDKLLKTCDGKLSLPTVLILAQQMVYANLLNIFRLTELSLSIHGI